MSEVLELPPLPSPSGEEIVSRCLECGRDVADLRVVCERCLEAATVRQARADGYQAAADATFAIAATKPDRFLRCAWEFRAARLHLLAKSAARRPW